MRDRPDAPALAEDVCVPSPQQLEVAAHSLIAVLGVWLGLTVFTRSRALQARTFSLLSYRTGDTSTRAVSRWSGAKPGSTPRMWAKLRIRSPAEAASTSARAN